MTSTLINNHVSNHARIFLVLSIMLTILVSSFVFIQWYHPVLILLWLCAITLYIYSFSNKRTVYISRKTLVEICIAFIIPILFRLVWLNIYRIHADEFISSYYSAHITLQTNFFGPIPPLMDWVSQFPAPYFFLQKIFFMFFSESPLTIKLSTLPYIGITGIILFLLGKKLSNDRFGMIVVFVYSLFAPALYIESFGLHFSSSMTVFMIFIYFLVTDFRLRSNTHACLEGISMGACYLLYLSSFIAFPVWIVVNTIRFITTKQKTVWMYQSFITFIGFLIVILPFLTYLIFINPYIIPRFNQVAPDLESFSILENTVQSAKALVVNNIGGVGGYDFGHRSFFSPISLLLFCVGLILGFVNKNKRLEWIILMGIILTAFFLGSILTQPNPSFHRFSLIFPLICLFIALPIYSIFNKAWKGNSLFLVVTLVLLIIYSGDQIKTTQNMFMYDVKNNREDLSDIKIINLVKSLDPQKKIYIAAFPSFALNKLFYFFTPDRFINTNYHDTLLNTFSKTENYYYIIIFPDEFKDKFIQKDLQGTYTRVSTKYGVFSN